MASISKHRAPSKQGSVRWKTQHVATIVPSLNKVSVQIAGNAQTILKRGGYLLIAHNLSNWKIAAQNVWYCNSKFCRHDLI